MHILENIIKSLDEEHAERMAYIEKLGIELRNEDDSIRRLYRENLRYETAVYAVRQYCTSVEEWNDPNYRIGDLVK